jgi:hypothetical protein
VVSRGWMVVADSSLTLMKCGRGEQQGEDTGVCRRDIC